jgi:hypothetical protein
MVYIGTIVFLIVLHFRCKVPLTRLQELETTFRYLLSAAPLTDLIMRLTVPITLVISLMAQSVSHSEKRSPVLLTSV